jgi:hypothetical protein
MCRERKRVEPEGFMPAADRPAAVFLTKIQAGQKRGHKAEDVDSDQ